MLKPWRFLIGLVLLLVSGWWVLFRIPLEQPMPVAAAVRLPERLWTHVFPPRIPKKARFAGLTGLEQEAVHALARQLDGMIVWSSNRSGNHQLYLLDLREDSLRQLTNHPHVNFYSRFSPDGKMIVFMRSRRPWVSFRDETAWDIYLINSDGTGERLLARQGYAPSWSPDGRAVIFSRGNRTIRVQVATGQENILLDADQAIPGAQVLGVSPSPDERLLAFTVRGVYDGVALYDPGGRHLIPMTAEQACQIAWAPDGENLAWIEIGGNGGTRVMAGRADKSGRRVLMDLPGAYSHEYFPKFSNDGRWLIWGAAAEGHEHDRADYEIFLWKVGTPWNQAIRLTYHPGNDQWPDLYVRGSSRALDLSRRR